MTGGTVKSDPGYSLALDAEFVGTGNDYIHADPDNKHLRLNAHGVIKTKDEALLYMNYTGVVTMGPAEQAVFSGKAEDGATPFGNSFTHFTFEVRSHRGYNYLSAGSNRYRPVMSATRSSRTEYSSARAGSESRKVSRLLSNTRSARLSRVRATSVINLNI
jgi:hypothetical protein